MRLFTLTLLLFFVFISTERITAQTDLVRKENKTIRKIDLLKIQNITDFFPMMPEESRFIDGTIIIVAGGEKQTQTFKTNRLTKQQKELLQFSDVNTKLFIDIKYIDLTGSEELVRAATAGIKIIE